MIKNKGFLDVYFDEYHLFGVNLVYREALPLELWNFNAIAS